MSEFDSAGPHRLVEMEQWLSKGVSVLVHGGERPLGAWHGPSLSEWEILWLSKRGNAVWFPNYGDEVKALIRDQRFGVVTNQHSRTD